MSSQSQHINEVEQCAVCLENLGNQNVTTLECGHRFHYTCIQHWHRDHSNCPCCRQNIVENHSVSNNRNQEIINTNLDTGLLVHQIAFHAHDIDISATCNRCNGDLLICEGCGYNMCFCNSNTQSRNGKNPFSSENDCFTCLECFHNRDATLIDWLAQSWAGDVFEREFIIEHYETYYINNSGENHPNYRSFNDYYDFVEYAEELLRESLANNEEMSFEDLHGGFNQEEIDEINQMNSEYHNEINNELNNINGRENIINSTTYFNEVLNISESINEIINNNIDQRENITTENITIQEYNNMLS